VRGSIDRTALAKAMKLLLDHKIILAQSVGHPKKEWWIVHNTDNSFQKLVFTIFLKGLIETENNKVLN